MTPLSLYVGSPLSLREGSCQSVLFRETFQFVVLPRKAPGGVRRSSKSKDSYGQTISPIPSNDLHTDCMSAVYRKSTACRIPRRYRENAAIRGTRGTRYFRGTFAVLFQQTQVEV